MIGRGGTQKRFGLPINRETTKELADVACENSLSHDYDRRKIAFCYILDFSVSHPVQ
jgi:hypothetical protein